MKFLPIFGLVAFFVQRKSILMALLTLELVVLTIIILYFFYIQTIVSCLVLMVVRACERSIGLALITVNARASEDFLKLKWVII